MKERTPPKYFKIYHGDVEIGKRLTMFYERVREIRQEERSGKIDSTTAWNKTKQALRLKEEKTTTARRYG